MKQIAKRLAAGLVCAVLLLVSIAPSLMSFAEIPAGASSFRGHSYLIYHQTISWTEAKAYCEKLGGHLATITSEEEQKFVESLNKDQNRLWVGGYRDDRFVWYWVTGEPWSYSHWGSGEPNNNDGNETKLTVWPLEWNDLGDNNLAEQSGFICEWDSSASDIVSWNGHRYQLIEQGMTWTEAKAYCERLGGHLVTITSQEEQNAVEKLIKNSEKNLFWAGAEKIDNTYIWITREPWEYSHWAPGQPNNYMGSGGENSLTIYNKYNPGDGGTFGQWNDLNKDGTASTQSFFGVENIGIICEWDPSSTMPGTTAATAAAPTTAKPTTPATAKPAAPTTTKRAAPATTRAPETLPALVTQTTAPDGSGQVQLDGQDYLLLRYEDFNYILQQLEALITQYLGTAQRVEIPAEIEAHPVIGVADNAFAQSQATEVVVPASVYRFGDHAFESQQGKMKLICEAGSPAAQYAQKNGNPVEFQQVYTTAAATEAATEAAAPARSLRPLLFAVAAGIIMLGLVAAILVLARRKKQG